MSSFKCPVPLFPSFFSTTHLVCILLRVPRRSAPMMTTLVLSLKNSPDFSSSLSISPVSIEHSLSLHQKQAPITRGICVLSGMRCFLPLASNLPCVTYFGVILPSKASDSMNHVYCHLYGTAAFCSSCCHPALALLAIRYRRI